jgi:hypothetical protein
MNYGFTKEISEMEQQRELSEKMKRENHKYMEKGVDKATELLTKDVTHGFSIPVFSEAVEKIKGVVVQPLGLATQFTLAAGGSRKIKH